MANVETVAVGCKLPNGIKLEIGLQKAVVGSAPAKGEHYQTFTLKGWNSNGGPINLQNPAPNKLKPQAFINFNVPKDFWEQWCKEHPKSWLLRNEVLFAAKSHADAATRKNDSGGTPVILGPIDKDRKVKVKSEGADAGVRETRTDE
jgi:hypothetical protein